MNGNNKILLAVTLILVGCAHDQCNNVPQRPPASETPGPSPTPTPAPNVIIPSDAVQIFKPTGDKQCERGKGQSLDDMQATLAGGNISVYESHTQSDGLMHMALCGSPSGTIHVFSISKKNLKKSFKLGFKVLNQK